MVDSLDAATDDGARALRRLQAELIGWLTTINPDGQPQASPIWFVWDGAELLLYSMTRAPRNGNIEDRPLVAFNLESGPEGEDVVTAEGEARIVPDEPSAAANATFLAKYQAPVRCLRLDAGLVRRSAIRCRSGSGRRAGGWYSAAHSPAHRANDRARRCSAPLLFAAGAPRAVTRGKREGLPEKR